MTTRWILVAHGSPRAEWFAPFDALVDELRAAGLEASLAFIGFREPTLAAALERAADCREIVVWPLFLASGGHITQDIAPEVERFRAAHPETRVELLPALLDDPATRRRLVDRAASSH